MISVVVPVFNERESLATLADEIGAALGPIGAFEVIFVDDGSRDGSWDVLRSIVEGDHRFRALRFRRNFGKAAALSAGFRAARGRVVLTLDADLQDDPSEAPRMLKALAEGYDVVSGWKKKRHDPWHKVLPSRIFNAAVSLITGCRLHDHNCGFKAYRREVLDEVEIYGELHRFIPVLAEARGFRVGEVVVNHRPRQHGRSKYGVARLPKGFLDLITVRFLTGFGQRPLHLLGAVGLVLIALGGVGLVYLAIEWLAHRGPIGTRPLLAYSALAMGVGVQFVCLGILAELTTSYHIRSHPTYSIVERLEPHDSDGSPPLPSPGASLANRSELSHD